MRGGAGWVWGRKEQRISAIFLSYFPRLIKKKSPYVIGNGHFLITLICWRKRNTRFFRVGGRQAFCVIVFKICVIKCAKNA